MSDDVLNKRRRFLQMAGAVAVGGTLARTAQGAKRSQKAERPYDIIVIGGGTAGLPLVIKAAERNARVLLIEKSPILGGTLDRSYASTSAAGSTLQKSTGLDDSPQKHYDEIMSGTRGAADPIVVKLWTTNAGATIDWLSTIGVNFSSPAGNGGRSRMITGQGKALVSVFEPLVTKAVQAGKVTVALGSRAVELIQDATGAVVGVLAENSSGATQQYLGRSVVLTAGGAMNNPQLYQEIHGVPLYYNAGYPWNQGDGLLLGQSVGGYLRGAEAYIPIMGIVMADDSVPSVPTEGTFQDTTVGAHVRDQAPWEIWVNSAGRRFAREDSTVSQSAERALGQQPGHRLWAVHDQEAFEKAPSPMRDWSVEKYRAGFGHNPMFYQAKTLEQLALKAGVDPHGLTASVAQYNQALTANAPDALGRTHRPAPIARAPFYAVRYQGYHLLTFAGLAVDHHLRVVRRDGSPVPNLYAAGEMLGAMALGCAAHSTGAMVTPSLTFGRLLGENLPIAAV